MRPQHLGLPPCAAQARLMAKAAFSAGYCERVAHRLVTPLLENNGMMSGKHLWLIVGEATS